MGHKHTSVENALRGFPKSARGDGERAYMDLVKWNIVIRKPTSYGDQIAINPTALHDVKQILNPLTADKLKDGPPLEESMNPAFEKKPFHRTYGEKTVKGVNALYSFHKKADGDGKINEDDPILAYVVTEGGKKSPIHLGAIAESGSLLRTAVERMDSMFKGQPFTKPHVYSLGKDIEGNRQPPKAIIDMLIYFGYVIPVGEKHFQRTNKQLPQVGLDAFQPSTLPISPSPLPNPEPSPFTKRQDAANSE